jgi:hypothetical protein
MSRIASRLVKLEGTAAAASGGNKRLFLLKEHDPLPDGITGDEEDVMVIRFVAVKPKQPNDREMPNVA